MTSIIPAIGTLTVILSAELDWRDDGRNLEAHNDLKARLARQFEIGELYGVLECRGAYKGVPERSIAINGRVGTVLAIAQAEADHFGQECYLVVDKDSSGVLHFTGLGDQQAIGRYSPITFTTADVEAWTQVIATGETFTFR